MLASLLEAFDVHFEGFRRVRAVEMSSEYIASH